MTLFKKLPEPLTIKQIESTVRSYLKKRGDIGLDLDEVTTETLASTPQWTFIQLVDNYLLALFNKKTYSNFYKQDQYYKLGVIPPKPQNTLAFANNAFKFFVILRYQDDPEAAEIIINKVQQNLTEIKVSNLQDIVMCFSTKMVAELQRYELVIDNPSSTDEFDSVIEMNINDNKNLLYYYLSIRTDFAKLIENTTVKQEHITDDYPRYYEYEDIPVVIEKDKKGNLVFKNWTGKESESARKALFYGRRTSKEAFIEVSEAYRKHLVEKTINVKEFNDVISKYYGTQFFD
ncbi:MAG: hypothetical protein WCG30_03750 [Candidatus Saccharibacteria bacterium]